ncbi:hypothetical protein BDV96DRAFT_599869 [Lophiotrema nucula]|uniref:Uncharacterized protein n=1 Tax=Lophiotrema nucula TaxID=690887 RepID=A0A6A5Z9X6_9PLEO|nr:hypothetical protein BDV96DRAFT_599869 [Lophiotrema nucula]
MGTHDKMPAFTIPNSHPSSPPMTPGSRTHARFPPQTSHTSPIYKRMGLSMLAQSPPLEFIQPTGQGHQFHFTRPVSRDQSSRPSSNSGPALGASPNSSEDEDEDEDESEAESAKEVVRPTRTYRRVDRAEFVLEELDSDPGYGSDIEVLRPDHYEEAKSDKGGKSLEENGFLNEFEKLRCQVNSSDEEEQEQRYIRKKKRWSKGMYTYKRSYTQSIEGDSSYSDDDPLDDNDPNARRLRRRVRGPGNRSSLIFEDKGFSRANIVMEEPEEGLDVAHSKGPPSIPSDDGFTLDELPFWVVEEMDVESDSS